MNIKIVHTLTDSNGTRAVLEAANTLTTHVRRPDFPAKDNENNQQYNTVISSAGENNMYRSNC